MEAWDKLMMVILELLSRAYGHERETATFDPLVPVDRQMVAELAERRLRARDEDEPVPVKDVVVAEAAASPTGSARSCRSMGSPSACFTTRAVGTRCAIAACIAAGRWHRQLEGDTLVCPWHGFQYNITTGECLADPSARLDMYPGERAGRQDPPANPRPGRRHLGSRGGGDGCACRVGALKPNEFRVADIPAGQIRTVQVDGEEAAVYNIDGAFYATGNACTHTGGPLSEGDLQERS